MKEGRAVGRGGELEPLEALVTLARSAREEPLPALLHTVAETVRSLAGYTAVVVNVYRPAWDDYEVVLVLGSEESRDALEGTRLAGPLWRRVCDSFEQRLPGVFFVPAGSELWDDFEHTHTPDIPDSEDPDAWRADDGLMVHLSDASGAPLGFLSVDEPAHGRRPTDDELRLLKAICSHAEQALESARHHERLITHQRILSQLMATSPVLSGCSTSIELLAEVCDAIVPGMGFDRVAAYQVGGSGALELLVTRGWESRDAVAETLAIELVEELLDAGREDSGCWLLEASELFGPAPGPRSRRNGSGPLAWCDHLLLAPCRDAGGDVSALIVIEDPADRMRPSDDLRTAVRLLTDHAAAALSAIEQRRQLRHVATHDPLTGVRNRHGLSTLLADLSDVALLVCDIDHFKEVNDGHGHDVGDLVLARFGELLREHTRDSDVPIRLGGEEFCLVLPGTDRAAALAIAERLRLATESRMLDLVPNGITISVGIAATSAGAVRAADLLRAADAGLYAAKRAGRNRCFDASELSTAAPSAPPGDGRALAA